MEVESEPSCKKRKGGIRQRLQAKQVRSQSVLAEFLLSQFAWGHFSGRLVQTVAALAIADVMKVSDDYEELDDLIKLSKLGSSGAISKNIHRDIMVYANPGVRLPAVFHFDVSFKHPFGQQSQAALLPHEMFSALFNNYNAFFSSSIVSDVSKTREFWKAVKDHPQMKSHPIASRAGYQKLAIPLGLHGDGVPIVGLGKGWVKMALVFSWSSLLGAGNTLCSQFYIWSVFEKLCVVEEGKRTLDVFFQILVWSLKWLWLGVWPDEDYQGKKFLICILYYTISCFFVYQMTLPLLQVLQNISCWHESRAVACRWLLCCFVGNPR
jgi:hypothetical protein